MKISSTNHIINNLICGESKKNSSLSGGERLAELKTMRNEKLGLIRKNDEEECETEDDKSKKPLVHKPGTKVDLEIEGTRIKVLCPTKRIAQSDLMVELDPDQLCAVFNYIQPDCNSRESTRKYKKTGKFSKAQDKGGEAEEVEG